MTDTEMLALIKESAMETLEPFVAACQERISGLERELLAARQEIADFHANGHKECEDESAFKDKQLAIEKREHASCMKERDDAWKEIATHKRMLKDICEEWNEDCDPQCDSIGHTETCKAVSIAQAKRAMREEIAALREDAERWREHSKVMEQATLPDALHLQLRAWRDGKLWGAQCVIDSRYGENTILGIKAIGLTAEDQAQKLFDAIASARALKGK